jgi:hypothetical protein
MPSIPLPSFILYALALVEVHRGLVEVHRGSVEVHRESGVAAGLRSRGLAGGQTACVGGDEGGPPASATCLKGGLRGP